MIYWWVKGAVKKGWIRSNCKMTEPARLEETIHPDCACAQTLAGVFFVFARRPHVQPGCQKFTRRFKPGLFHRRNRRVNVLLCFGDDITGDGICRCPIVVKACCCQRCDYEHADGNHGDCNQFITACYPVVHVCHSICGCVVTGSQRDQLESVKNGILDL